jgi:hypothetical protein
MDGDIALPAWVPSKVDLDTPTSVLIATRDGIRLAQLKLATERGEAWGIQYGVAGLDGCAPEHSVPVKVSGQPGRLRVSADPDGSSRKWVQLVWPATLKHSDGVFGLFGWFSPRAVRDGRVDAACVLAAGPHGSGLLTVAAVRAS